MFFAIKESSVAAFIEKIRFWLPLEVNDQFLLLIKAVFMVRILLLVACLCLSLSVSAQSLSGVVKDKASDEVLISATVKLVPENGSALFTTTDLSGQFYFNKLKSGTYVLNISYVGYKAFMETVKIANTSNKINVYMQENSQLLGEVAVTGRATRAEQRGDSLMYNAEAFKVMQGSSAEDLLAKMPGVVVEGGTVQAQGEQVEKILVDGKEFFEGDVSLAVKNLPSDIIASIEIFDKKSDQSEFTGFDDGEEVKTINIVTKTGFRQGTFGEMTAGYGTDERYKANGNLNFFNENQRISVLGMSNNVNQQNFSQEDLTGILSSNSGNKRKGFRNGGGKKGYQSGSSVADFMIGSIDGLTSTNGLGLNYVDQWGKKLKITSSYFFNKSDNQTLQQTNRNYLDAALAGMSYEEYKEKVQKAIVETKGEILTYQGKCISALFYSSSNGKSENVENYFKGSSQPYLVSVDSHWDQEYDPQFIRKVKYTKAQLNSLFGGSFQYRFLEHYPSGRVKSILINQKQYSGREVREKLQLSSSDFEIVKEGNSYIFVTKGCGHGVGLSQYGAQGMAKEGYNYQAILKHYYQGVEISKNKE